VPVRQLDPHIFMVNAPVYKVWQAIAAMQAVPYIHSVRVVKDPGNLTDERNDVAWTPDYLRGGTLLRLSGRVLFGVFGFSLVPELTEVRPLERIVFRIPRQAAQLSILGAGMFERLEIGGEGSIDLQSKDDITRIVYILAVSYVSGGQERDVPAPEIYSQMHNYFKRYSRNLEKHSQI